MVLENAFYTVIKTENDIRELNTISVACGLQASQLRTSVLRLCRYTEYLIGMPIVGMIGIVYECNDDGGRVPQGTSERIRVASGPNVQGNAVSENAVVSGLSTMQTITIGG